MAVDEAILESVSTLQSPPTLRLYAWDPPCLSMGYAQPAADVDLDALAVRGWSLVRRPTGGRAILHTDELTYAVIATLDNPVVAGSVLESYARIARGLLAALERLSLAARSDRQYQLPDGASPQGPVCFEVPSKYEITVEGKKLVGSAQARRKNGVLQHGTLPLTGDLSRITQVLAVPDEASRASNAQSLLNHAATVERVLGHTVGWDQAAEAMSAAFRDIFAMDLLPSSLSTLETQKAHELQHAKYAHPSWTFRI